MSLGDMTSARDWGSAADYAIAMPAALDIGEAQDFVFATGKRTTVREFFELAARAAGFSPTFEGEGVTLTCRDNTSGLLLATVSERYFRPHDTPPLIGNPARLKAVTKFAGSRDIAAIAEEMIRSDISRRQKGLSHV
jgi:GDPmannose 4,6-dehydratase